MYLVRLLQWLAYWAIGGYSGSVFIIQLLTTPSKGWYRTISSYRNKIYLLLQKIARHIHRVHVDNRVVVDKYYDGWAITCVKFLLHHTKLVAEGTYIEPEMTKFIDEFSAAEES